MTRESIGEFEQLVMLATLRLDDKAYGLSILEEVRERTGRSVLRPAVYVALRRLEEKGLLDARLGDASEARGGRPRKYFTVTQTGLARLRRSRDALLSMWEGVHAALDAQ